MWGQGSGANDGARWRRTSLSTCGAPSGAGLGLVSSPVCVWQVRTRNLTAVKSRARISERFLSMPQHWLPHPRPAGLVFLRRWLMLPGGLQAGVLRPLSTPGGGGGGGLLTRAGSRTHGSPAHPHTFASPCGPWVPLPPGPSCGHPRPREVVTLFRSARVCLCFCPRRPHAPPRPRRLPEHLSGPVYVFLVWDLK